MTVRPKILLLSAYDAMSHRYWRRGLVSALADYDWTVLSLPARHFAWRSRGNALSWGLGEPALSASYDLVVATSMTDLATLRGLVPALAATPTLVYFHENQFAYPESERQFVSVEPKMLNLYTALAADRVLFNTDYNRQTFLAGVEALLRKLPDHVPAGVVDCLDARSQALPVPLPDSVYRASCRHPGPLRLIWNHRWEYDKAPERLLEALRRLKARNVDFELALVGQQFRRTPKVMGQFRAEFGDALTHFGYVDSVDDYRQLLAEADCVLSTAVHDFQGIAVLEGVAAGALPVVPERLAYPELFGRSCCYGSDIESPDAEATALADRLQQLARLKQQGDWPALPVVDHLSWTALAPRYRAEIEALLSSSGQNGAGQ